MPTKFTSAAESNPSIAATAHGFFAAIIRSRTISFGTRLV